MNSPETQEDQNQMQKDANKGSIGGLLFVLTIAAVMFALSMWLIPY